MDTGFPSDPAPINWNRPRFIDLGETTYVDRELMRDQEKWTPVFRPIQL